MRTIRSLVAIATMAAATSANAQILFSTGNGPDVTLRTANQGPSQRVSVTNTTQLGQFGFWLGTTGTVDLKFMIWNGTGTTKLFEQVKTVTNSATGTLVLTDAFNFTLVGGQTYDFAVIGNGDYNVGAFFGQASFSQNGFSNVNPNGNYGPYANPTFQGLAGATIAVQLRAPTVVVPEPGTYALLATGMAVLVFVRRRRSA